MKAAIHLHQLSKMFFALSPSPVLPPFPLPTPQSGHQDSTVSVFTRDADGSLRHFYSAHPRIAPDIPERGIDLLAPIWHFMDLTPQGRGNWYTSLDYGTKVQAASK